MDDIIDNLQKTLNLDIKKSVSFTTITTYKAGGICKYLISPKNIDELIILLKVLRNNNIPFKIWGNGSNILASDKVYNGVIIKLDKFNKIEINDTNVKVGAGYNLLMLANDCSRKGLSGLEWACGIPGTVGGATYMNAGAYLKSMADIVKEVEVLTDNYDIICLKNEDMKYSYRSSILMNIKNYIVLNVILQLEKKDPIEIMNVVLDRKSRRINSQPLEYPSAGSVFRNPEGFFAGHLIEECNLKGKQLGNAQISDKHANFIVNKGNADAKDIKALIDLAQTKVKEKYNINLKLEQELFNWE